MVIISALIVGGHQGLVDAGAVERAGGFGGDAAAREGSFFCHDDVFVVADVKEPPRDKAA